VNQTIQNGTVFATASCFDLSPTGRVNIIGNGTVAACVTLQQRSNAIVFLLEDNCGENNVQTDASCSSVFCDYTFLYYVIPIAIVILLVIVFLIIAFTVPSLRVIVFPLRGQVDDFTIENRNSGISKTTQ